MLTASSSPAASPSGRRASRVVNVAGLVALALAACGGGGPGVTAPGAATVSAGGAGAAAATPAPTATPTPPTTAADDTTPPKYQALFPDGTAVNEVIQYTDADGTLVTRMGMRPTERHARERGEAWDAADAGPGRYLTFPSFYFQNRTFGIELRDTLPRGGKSVEHVLHVNDGTFDGLTYSIFRNVQNPNTRDYGWSLNYGFNNPDEGGKPICHAGDTACRFSVDANWRTDPHSTLKIGDPMELAPAPRLARDANDNALADGGGSRYYSFEQLYVVGQGLRPWYGVSPNLDSAPLPEDALSGGLASVSYNYSEEPHLMFEQMANNIGIDDAKRFVQGRRLFNTSFATGQHSEHADTNPVFTAHADQLGPRFNQERCEGCHVRDSRSLPVPANFPSDNLSVLTAAASTSTGNTPDPTYGVSIQQHARASSDADYGVAVARFESSLRTLPDGTQVPLQKPVYTFRGPVPAVFSARIAPQVIGLGLLEAVPEQTVVALARANASNPDGVRGTPNWIADPETGQVYMGRFGWKAAKVSLRHQAAEAFANDLGVTTPIFPRRSCHVGGADCHAPGAAPSQVSAVELQQVANYLSLIGVPAQRKYRSGFPDGVRVSAEHDVDPPTIARGRALFDQAGCGGCHVTSLVTGDTHPFAEVRRQVIHPYTDLLLHDMGADLADGLQEGRAKGSMWRTAPLWGLGMLRFVQHGPDKSANYPTSANGEARFLHDGRARSPLEAILWHGGEATSSRRSFEALSADERRALLTFLDSL